MGKRSSKLSITIAIATIGNWQTSLIHHDSSALRGGFLTLLPFLSSPKLFSAVHGLRLFCPSPSVEGSSGDDNSKQGHACFPTCEQGWQVGRDFWGTNIFICDNWDRGCVNWPQLTRLKSQIEWAKDTE